MRSKLGLVFMGASALLLAAILVVASLMYARTVSTSGAEQSTATSVQTLAKQIKTITNRTNTLLTNGKTTSAISAKKTEQLALEIKALVKAGSTARAEQSAAAVASAKAGNLTLNRALTLLVGEIKTNRASGLVTRKILCSGAELAHPQDLTIKQLCGP